jgi:type II secretory pathway pseudopilin PulG
VRRRGGLTLVEVVLAILIISGIMTVLLFFYQRAAMVRQSALEEAQFLAETRMFLDQLTGELRAARLVPEQVVGFEGGSNWVDFVCTSLPQTARWITSTNDPVTLAPSTDLKRVRYQLMGGTNLVAVRGLDRVEELLLGAGYTVSTNPTEFVEAETNLTADADALMSTNQFALARPPLTERIQFLQFRFWDGRQWHESWSGMDLPNGVEITLGREAMPVDATEGYPFEIFRRTVYLPNSPPLDNQIIVESEFEEFPL